ncbi:MAG: SIMPL domain-containing protein [Gammaproteobacteria bacterium]|nr:SIMPL domain-containing protein [Gammaproteobacteria bacterium]
MGTKRFIAVTGDAEVTTTPDRAVLALGVELRDTNQSDAQHNCDVVVRKFLEVCQNLEISDAHVGTSQLYIQPEYDRNPKTGERKMIGYLVRRSLEVKLNDLGKLGSLMEQATAIGINQTSGPRFESSRKRELQRKALQLAATEARLNAVAAAAALDTMVGGVRSIRTTNLHVHHAPRGARPKVLRAASASSDNGGADTYSVGQIRIEAEVAVEFDLTACS